jgi:hypothetical protein
VLRLPTLLLAAAIGTAAIVPATASAKVELGGAISMRLVDSHHATVAFASDQLPAKADGKLDARIVMAPGKRPGALRKVGMHGADTRYSSTVASTNRFRVDARYTVRLKIAGQKDIVRQIKLIDNRR